MRTLHLLALAALLTLPGALAQQGQTVVYTPTPIDGLTMEGPDEALSIPSKGTKVAEFRLENTGDRTLSLRFGAFETSQGSRSLTLVVDPEYLVIEPGQNATARLNISVAESAAQGSRISAVLSAAEMETRGSTRSNVEVVVEGTCEECTPPPPPTNGGPVMVITAAPAKRPTTTPATPTNAITISASSNAEGANELPAPGIAAGIVALAIAARARSKRKPRGTWRHRLGLLLVLATLPTGALAQSAGGDVRSFAILRVARVGDDIEVTVTNTHYTAFHVTFSVSVGGTLASTDHVYEAWSHRETHTLRFPNVKGADPVFHVHYYRNEIGRVERTTLDLPAAPAPRIEVTGIDPSPPDGILLTLSNLGERASGPLRVRVEDDKGARLGEPIAQRIETIPANSSATARFGVPTGTRSVVVVIEDGENTTRTTMAIREDANGPKLVVTSAALDDMGGALVRFRNVGTSAATNVLVHIEDKNGARIGDPFLQAFGALPAGREGELRFGLPPGTSEIVVILDHDNRTTRSTLVLPRATSASRVEVTDATLTNATLATIRVRNPTGSAARGVSLALETLQGVRMGEPLTQRIDELAPGAERSVQFNVPSGTNEVRLVVTHADGSANIPLRLVAGNGASGTLQLRADLPSRDARPGSSVNFEVKIVNNGAEALVDLDTIGLAPGYDASFAVGGSAVRTLVVPASSTRELVVTVRVPEAASKETGRSVPFTLVARSGDASAELALSLAVTGAGKLELAGQNWFTTARAGEPQTLSVSLRNTGSAALADISLAASAPSGWRTEFSPARVDRLEAGASREIEITITPDGETSAGRYLLDVSAKNAELAARSRSLSVEVAGDEKSSIGWVVGAGLAGLAATGLIIKLRRR